MTDWRPIETAPKDGTLILVAGPKMGVMFDATAITVVAWGGFEWKPMVGGWQAYEDSLEDAQPTHWMPLPDPPVRTEIA